MQTFFLSWLYRHDEAPALQEAEQDFVAKVEAALQSNDVDEDRLIEERRRRRQEILAKHQQENQAGAGGQCHTAVPEHHYRLSVHSLPHSSREPVTIGGISKGLTT